MPGRGVEQVHAADDVGDLLGFVIDRDGELVGPKAIAAAEDEVPGGGPEIFGKGAGKTVGEGEWGVGDAKAKGVRRGRAGAGAAFAIVAASRDFAGATAGVGVAGGEQLGKGGGVERAALALVDDRFVPMEGVGFQLAQDNLVHAGEAAACVDIFHADEPFSAMMPGVEETGDGGDETAKVERAGGRRGEPATIGGRRESG